MYCLIKRTQRRKRKKDNQLNEAGRHVENSMITFKETKKVWHPLPKPRVSPGGFSGKNLPVNAGDTGDARSVRKIPRVGNGNLLQYSCPENSTDRGAWWATVHGVTKSQTWLSTHAGPKPNKQKAIACHASISESNAVTRKSRVLETQFTEDSLHNTLIPMRAITLNSSHPYPTDYIIQEYPECMDLSWVNQLFSKWNYTIFITSKEHAELLVNIMITFSSTIP